jgi:hypothetical protein
MVPSSFPPVHCRILLHVFFQGTAALQQYHHDWADFNPTIKRNAQWPVCGFDNDLANTVSKRQT